MARPLNGTPMSLNQKIEEDLEFANAMLFNGYWHHLAELATSRIVSAGVYTQPMVYNELPRHLYRYRVPTDVCSTILKLNTPNYFILKLIVQVLKACISNDYQWLYDEYCTFYDKELHTLAAKMCRIHYYDHQESFNQGHIECEFDYLVTLPLGLGGMGTWDEREED